MKLIYLISFCAVIGFVQCSSKYNEHIENVLDDVNSKQADDLEAVLEYYTTPQDSLKRKAAYFLVENFPKDKYQTIDKQLLIENIELAFQVWKKPWAKQLNFDEFKELVLPFDLERDSTGTFWRKRFMDEYAFVEDSLKNYPDETLVVAACNAVMSVLKRKYHFDSMDGRINPMSLNQWEIIRKGDCASSAYLTNHIMHSVGVPTAVEFTPQWTNLTNSHYWNVVLVNHWFIPFVGVDQAPRHYKIELFGDFIRKRSKVFRRIYAQNPLSLASLTDEAVPPIFRNTHLLDISTSRIPVKNLTVALPDSINQPYLYLSVFKKDSFREIMWGKQSGANVTFEGVRTEAFYIPTCYKNGRTIPVGYPFIFRKNGQKHILKPQLNATRAITCLKKYPYDDTNLIEIGDLYQLFFWDKTGWKSLGKKVATEKKLTFDKVPQNALLLLRDLTRGKQERVFIYQNGKQEFL